MMIMYSWGLIWYHQATDCIPERVGRVFTMFFGTKNAGLGPGGISEGLSAEELRLGAVAAIEEMARVEIPIDPGPGITRTHISHVSPSFIFSL